MPHQQHLPQARARTWAAIGCAGLAAGLVFVAGCGASTGSGTSDQVTVAAGQQQYGTHDRVAVTITNGLASAILAADHQSNCTVVTIERQDGQTWQPQNPCLLKSATRLITLAPGSVTPVQLDPPAGAGVSGWTAGTYRLSFTYRTDSSGSEMAITSPTFAIS